MEEGLKLILEMGDNAGNAFYYWLGMRIFSELISLAMLSSFFYLIFILSKMAFSELGMGKYFKQVGGIVGVDLNYSPSDDDIKKVIEVVKILKKKE